MSLKTKSVQAKKEESDGIRICIMRRIKPEFEFDMWLPALSPSTELLKDYHEERINWGEFEEKLKKELFPKRSNFLKMVTSLSEENTVTLLCWEKTPEKCHRRLVAEQIKEEFPEIKLELC